MQQLRPVMMKLLIQSLTKIIDKVIIYSVQKLTAQLATVQKMQVFIPATSVEKEMSKSSCS